MHAALVRVFALSPVPGNPIYFSWDDHANAQNGWDLAKGMRLRATDMDPALSALIDDIYDRGLDEHPRLLGRDQLPHARDGPADEGGREVERSSHR